MSETESFEADAPQDVVSDAQFVLDLDGYEGPIDVLLNLARDQKVDLTRISILDLADQYLAFVSRARRLRLELAADYLVMAAWLAYLKSRLLLPEPEGEAEPTGAELAAALAFQLQRLEAMQKAGKALLERAQLGRDVFARGAPEGVTVVTRAVYKLSLYELLKAYGEQVDRRQPGQLRILPNDLYSMDDALHRLRGMLGQSPDWHSLFHYLPPDMRDGLRRRAALAATFAATLELVRSGRAELRQDGTFGPIFLRAAPAPTEAP
ncbi:MAG: ScpA family protein [Dongiaceae bacterium]